MAQSKQLTRLEAWHCDLIDLMIANPRLSGRAAATHFGVSPVWISIIKNLPIFQAEFNRRRERISQDVEDRIVGGATALTEMSLDIMAERIDRDRDTISLGQVAQVTKTAAKILGLGGRNAPPPSSARPAEVKIVPVDPEVLAEARERMRRRNRLLELEEAATAPTVAVREENPVKAG